MLEKQIEKYLVRKVTAAGGVAYKFTSPARRSVPDRLCVFPNGDVIFVEVKQQNGVLTSGQRRECNRLMEMQQHVEVVYSKEDIDYLLNEREVLNA